MSSDNFTAEEQRIREAYARRSPPPPFGQPGQLFILQGRERAVLAHLARHGLADLKPLEILDVGCGNGGWIRDLIRWGADPPRLHGLDLLENRVREGRALCPSAVDLRQGNADSLPYPDGSMDLVIQATVFTSILDDALKHRIAAEMVRVLRPGGAVLWYDYHVNNPWNRDVRGVPRREIRALFPDCAIALRRATLIPPLARRLAPWSVWLCSAIEALKVFCSHYVGIIRKPVGTNAP